VPVNTPPDDEWRAGSLQFRFRYERLERGLIPRFIVESHKNLCPQKACWRTGGFFEAAGCSIMVVGKGLQKTIDVYVRGPESLRRAALSVILNDLIRVHDLNPEAKPRELVPLPDRPDLEVSYDHLLMLEREMGQGYLFFPERAEHQYVVGDLLDGVRFERAPRRGRREDGHEGITNIRGDRVVVNIGSGDIMSGDTKIEATHGGQVMGAAGAGGSTRVSHSRQSIAALSQEPPTSIEREQFERDVGELLTMLVDAKEELEAKYESVRVALRKLQQVDLEAHPEALAVVQAKVERALSEPDKDALRSLKGATGAVVTNLISSGLWKYLIEPVIAVVG
jgi:hypothetical protein